MMEYERKYKWLPYKILRFFVVALLILTFLGPVNYKFDIFFGFLMVLYILAFLLVTWYGMLKASHYRAQWFVGDSRKHTLIFLIKLATIVTLIVKIGLVLSSVAIYGLPEMSNVADMMAESYTDLFYEEGDKNIFRQIDTFLKFVYYFSTFAGIFWRKKLPKIFMIIICVNVLLDLFYNVCYIGTQRMIITIALVLLTQLLVSSVGGNLRINKKKLRRVALLVGVMAVFFVSVLSARKELWADGEVYWNTTQYDYDNFLLILFTSNKTKYDVCKLVSYMTQGFYGLSLAMQTPPQWTFMLGSVRGINSIVSQVFPFIPNMVGLTYPVRAGKVFGMDGLASWYTIFPWLASDLGWIGALIYMGFVGWLFMRCWIQAVEYDNPLAFTLLVLLVIQYAFLVANNQLFIDRGESVATVFFLLMYWLYGKGCNFEKRKPEIQSTGV